MITSSPRTDTTATRPASHRPGAPARAVPASRRSTAQRVGHTTLALATAAATAGVLGVGAGPASATTVGCAEHRIAVFEAESRVATSTYLTPGRSLRVSGGGSVNPGFLFGGSNGPAGVTDLAGSAFPKPGAPKFSLLARVGAGPWQYVGLGSTVVNTGTSTQTLQFRVNDDVPDNGSGAFTASFTTCGNVDAPSTAFTVNAVVARHSGKCLDVANASLGHAAAVVQASCWGGANQQWTARPVGAGYYEIVARHSGKCLDVAHASLAHAAPVVQGTCWGGSNQLWRFVPTGAGYHQIVARHSAKCLDVAHASLSHAAPVVQGTCWGGSNQQWIVR